MHFGGSNPACVHFGGSAGYDVSGSGCQTTSSSSEPQFNWGISRIRSFWFRMQNQFQYFRAASFNPFVSTTTPPYYSLTTYHLRQIYASTVALKTALKIVPLNYRCAKMNTPQHRRRWLTPTSNTYDCVRVAMSPAYSVDLGLLRGSTSRYMACTDDRSRRTEDRPQTV